MKNTDFLEQFLMKSDEEIQEFAANYGVKLSREEIRRLRPIAQSASISWLITGIPHSVIIEVENIIGRKKLKQLMSFLNYK